MSEVRTISHQFDKNGTLTGVVGLALLVASLIVYEPIPGYVDFLGFLGLLVMVNSGKDQQRGIRAGICGMVFITFGLLFFEPVRLFIGCVMVVGGTFIWRAARSSETTAG